ncbi:hypothetical protein V500_10731 [Pseudogymnoascus sp. VKM F-4518 (FW-2643)]|nr:hypothetical protein V500_10731 [Pseudogymnoascus sp. VKM F-4518 (FW-2643)]
MLPNLRGLVGLSLVALIGLATAQTQTDCNPREKDCPEEPALAMRYNFDFSQESNGSTWNVEAGHARYQKDGVLLPINAKKESPTLKSQFTIMFGRVEVHMKAARGQGIVSSIVLLSKDLDEVDWELIGGNETHVQSNYFGKGNETSYDRAFWHPVEKPMDEFHNYTLLWTAKQLDFFVDTEKVRTLMYEDALGGQNYPQTPMTVQLGIWAGGDPDNKKGVIEWAGGETNFDNAPFHMYIKSVDIEDFGTGAKAYKYGDLTGSWESIKSIPGNSTQHLLLLDIKAPPKPTISDKFNALPSTSKVAIYASAGGAAFLLAGLCLFSCCRKRRQGKREALAFRAKQEAMDREDAAYQIELKAAGISPDALGPSGMTAQEFAAGGVVKSPGNDRSVDPPIPTVPAAYQGQGASLKSPSGSLRPGAAPYGDAAGLRSPALASPGYAGGGQFNNPRSPGPGGYSVNSRNGSGGGYMPAAAPNNSTEYFAPQPRSNTNGSWNSAAAEDMGRSGSSNSQRPRGNGNGGYGGYNGGGAF